MIAERLANLLINLPKEFIILIISALPITELRGALPLAILKFQFTLPKAYFIAIIGNLLPVIPIILFLDKIRSLLRHIKIFNTFFNWLYLRTEKKSALIEKYGAIGLILFVAIPLPVTGAWTGSVAALIFKIKIRHALPAITAGVMIAGIIVSLITGGIQFFTDGGILGYLYFK